MVQRSCCADAATWQQLVSGRLPAPEAEALEQHLAECGACLQTVRNLPLGDTLEEALRSQSTPARLTVPEVIQRLMDRVKQLRPTGPASGSAPTGALSQASQPPAKGQPAGAAPLEQTQETYDFLAPAQAAGELGRLGSYRILKVLGSGGMGVVFLAEDIHLDRQVALKVMKPNGAANPQAKQRFLREAKACASLQHDHVITIHQVGEDRGVPFLAMEFLQGKPLDGWLVEGRKVAVPQILRIGREIAKGLAAAHEKGLIHRDIKPGNVWLDKNSGRVKILDFGLARTVAEDVQLTQSGAIMGTPAYMAPEQARGEKVDGRCDLFSLGCVLYRMSTGELPFKGTTTMAVLSALMLTDPKPVYELNPAVPAALSDLIGRLLAKNADDRPASAKEVIKAIQAIEVTLSSSPATPTASAAPVNPFQDLTDPAPKQAVPAAKKAAPRPTASSTANAPRGRRGSGSWRKWVAAVAGTILGGGLLAGVIIIIKNRDGTKTQIEVPGDNQARIDAKGQVIIEPKERPPIPVVPVGASPFDALQREAISAYELKAIGEGKSARVAKELVAILGESRLSDSHGLTGVAWSPDGKQLVSGSFSAVRIWDAATGQLGNSFPRHPIGAISPAYSPDGKQLAVGGMHDRAVTIYDPNTGSAKLTLKGHTLDVSSVVYSRDGKRLASSSSPQTTFFKGPGEIKVWDTANGQELVNIPVNLHVCSLAFSPDGKRLLGGVRVAGGGVKLWDTATGKEQLTLSGMNGYVRCVAFHPDGKWVAAGEENGGLLVKIWDAETGKEVRTYYLGSSVFSLAYSPNGAYLAAGAPGGLTVVWEAGSGREVRRLPCQNLIVGLAFSPDSKSLAVAQKGGRVRVWDVAAGKEVLPVVGHGGAARAVVVSPDGQWLASGGEDGSIRTWDAATGRQRATFLHSAGGYITCLALSPDGKRLASAIHHDQTVKVWDPLTGKELFTAQRDRTHQYNSLAFSPDGKHLIGVDKDGRFTSWDAATGKSLFDRPGNRGDIGYGGLAYSPDGKLVAAGIGSTAKVWEAETWKEVHTFTDSHAIVRVVFSSDGKRLFTSISANNPPRVWDVATGKEAPALQMTNSSAGYVVNSPDGRTIVGASDSRIVAWDAATGELQREIVHDIPGRLRDLALAPDGRHLVTANGNGTLYVFRLAAAVGKQGQVAP